MRDFAKKVADKAQAGVDSAQSLLANMPVIGAYQDKEMRREADRKLRESLSISLEGSRKRIIEIERLLLNKGKLNDLPYADVAANRLQTLIDRIRTAPSGYAGFFDREKIRERELTLLHQFDERIAASIPIIDAKIEAMKQAIAAGRDYSQSLVDLIKNLDELSERLDHRKEAIRAAGEETAVEDESAPTPEPTPTEPQPNSVVPPEEPAQEG